MDIARMKKKIADERANVEEELAALAESERDAAAAERGAGAGDADAAQPLAQEGVDMAIATSFRERLAALDRADRRIVDGTFGLSVRSGVQIPPARLEADPAAELTVEEAAAEGRRR